MPFFVFHWILFSVLSSGKLFAEEEAKTTNWSRIQRSPAIEISQIYYDEDIPSENNYSSETVALPTCSLGGSQNVTGISD
jgi:hypothetical protein